MPSRNASAVVRLLNEMLGKPLFRNTPKLGKSPTTAPFPEMPTIEALAVVMFVQTPAPAPTLRYTPLENEPTTSPLASTPIELASAVVRLVHVPAPAPPLRK